MNKKLWWGYIHENGKVQVKPYYCRGDIEEALESPFVAEVVWPFEANDRTDALGIVEQFTK